MKVKRKYMRDNIGVSPVIAVILMLAITVVLASVAYIMFSGLIPSAESSKIIGVVVDETGDGTNWSISIISTPGGMSADHVHIITRNKSGDLVIPKTPLSNFSGFIDLDPIGEVNGGDYILLPVESHPIFSTMELVSENNVMTHRVLE
jgi:flagellin-like protein